MRILFGKKQSTRNNNIILVKSKEVFYPLVYKSVEERYGFELYKEFIKKNPQKNLIGRNVLKKDFMKALESQEAYINLLIQKVGMEYYQPEPKEIIKSLGEASNKRFYYSKSGEEITRAMIFATLRYLKNKKNMGQIELFKLEKGKNMSIGTVNQRKNGKKYKKVAPGKWQEVTDKQKSPQKNASPSDDKNPLFNKQKLSPEQKGKIKNLLKKIISGIGDLFSSQDQGISNRAADLQNIDDRNDRKKEHGKLLEEISKKKIKNPSAKTKKENDNKQ